MACDLHLSLRVKMTCSLTAGPKGGPRASRVVLGVAELCPVLVASETRSCVHLALSGGRAQANPDHTAFNHLL